MSCINCKWECIYNVFVCILATHISRQNVVQSYAKIGRYIALVTKTPQNSLQILHVLSPHASSSSLLLRKKDKIQAEYTPVTPIPLSMSNIPTIRPSIVTG